MMPRLLPAARHSVIVMMTERLAADDGLVRGNGRSRIDQGGQKVARASGAGEL